MTKNNSNNIQKIKKQQQRRKDYYLKLWGLDENNSHTEAQRFTKQYPPEPYYLPKNRFLKDWNWQQKFNSLEEATEFLLNYCTELGPLARECINRLNKNSELIKQLTFQNKSLKTQMKGVYSNDTRRRKNEEKGAI